MLATLLDRGEGVALPLPPELAERYGGPLRFPDRSPFVFANFVSTLDGVVSYDVPGLEGAQQVSASHAADRAPFTSRAILDLVLRETGGTRILTEGGPTVLGSFLREDLIDELFLTVAPRLAGRSPEHRRLALVEAAAFEPKTSPRGRLLSLKSADDYLFTRYAIGARPG